jgi:NADPH:quinone reductase-like Zn-dependent oxidoreductase
MSEIMMNAIRYYQFGVPEVLKLEQVPQQEPLEGEVLVRVHAAGVLPVDWKIRKGLFPMPIQFPHIPGTAFAGVVVGLGSGVTEYQIGQAVFGRSSKGTYAEYTTAPIESITLKPESMSFDEAATISGGATTAWRAIIQDGGVKAGDRVLVHGAAGGVGLFATQFARWKGAYVIGTCGPANVDFVRALGAETVIDYTSTPFEQVVQDADLVLDTMGGNTLERSWSVIRRGGMLISLLGQPPSMDKAQELGVRIMRPSLATSHDLSNIAVLMDQGTIKTFVERIYSLSEAHLAHEHSQTGHGRGRIVLHIAD